MAIDCPECAYRNTGVTDSRPSLFSGFITTRRRRQCPKCRHRFTTYEASEAYFRALTVIQMKAIGGKISDSIIEKYFRQNAQGISETIAAEIERL